MSQGNAHFYSAYGLKIKSSVKFPGFVELNGIECSQTDVEILHQKISRRNLEKIFGSAEIFNAPDCDVSVTDQAMSFSYPQTGTILVTGGRQVLVDLKPEACDEDIIPYLTGYVLAVLLHQRNFLVLHASVMLVNGIGVAFLGAKGQGKSTLAASLEVLGNRLISDDLLPIAFESSKIFALPGYPQIKLFEDSVNAVGAIPSQLPSVHRNNRKYLFSCQQFSEDNIQLSAIYVLKIDDEISIEPISRSGAFIEAITHTHVNYYLKYSDSLEWHFEKCRQLVRSIPFFSFNRPHDFGRIDEAVGAITNHIEDLLIRS